MRKPYACQSLSAHLLASTTRFTMPVRHGCSFGPMHAPALIFVTLPCTLNCRVRCIWHNVVCLFRAFFRHDAQQWPDGKMDAMCCWLSLSLGWLLLHATAIPSQLFVLLDAILSGPHTLSSICPFPYTMDAGCLFYSDGFRTCRVVAPPCYLDHSFVPTINTCSSHISASATQSSVNLSCQRIPSCRADTTLLCLRSTPLQLTFSHSMRQGGNRPS